ncbi:relaxase/mobilization nuclease domain-containing protein [Rhodopseudomonas sp. P1]|uniref:relaxase/mobilization nuclease domain-containing protein n=1 Tax=Rhodopseudomonas sp. P1 TaxID=3434357 RepID=UPI0031FC211C
MVPKLFRSGKSFKKAGMYLLHDPAKASTAHRVPWTHTINLASDHPSLAIDEMYWTYRSADQLKREAGLKAGGRQLEYPVRHISLNWHRSESPSREQMIEAAESFLAHMGWHEHQTLIVCHSDKHPHVHLMVNAVHPETGRALDSSFEKRRVQEWAETYEREHEAIFCEERLKPVGEREPSPNRKIWERMKSSQHEFERSEYERISAEFDYFIRNDEGEGKDGEWRILKDRQRGQRERFFMDGRQAFRTVRDKAYRTVSREFKAEWRGYYQAKREGLDEEALDILKAGILERRDKALDERRNEACRELREKRDEEYAALLEVQKQERARLREGQESGQRAYWLLDGPPSPFAAEKTDATRDQRHDQDLTDAFRGSSHEITDRREDEEREEAKPREDFADDEISPADSVNPGRAKGLGDVGLGIAGALGVIGERLFDGFFGGGTKMKDAREPRNETEAAKAKAAQRVVEEQSRMNANAEEEAKLVAYWLERRERKRERD